MKRLHCRHRYLYGFKRKFGQPQPNLYLRVDVMSIVLHDHYEINYNSSRLSKSVSFVLFITCIAYFSFTFKFVSKF